MDELTAQVAAAPAADLLPARLREETSQMPEHLTLVGAATLPGTGSTLAVMSDQGGALFAGPVASTGRRGVRRTRPGEGAAHALATTMASGVAVAGNGFATTLLLPAAAHDDTAASAHERPMLVDQTHESVVVGDRAVVKWSVHAESTPATVLVPHLVESGFAQMPRPWGFVTWRSGAGAVPVLVASVMDYLPDASDGWAWAVRDVGDAATGAVGLTSALAPMAVLGRLVADLHLALATSTSVLPDPTATAGPHEVSGWRQLADRLLDQAVEVVDGPEGARLADLRNRIADVFADLGDIESTVTMPVHGDLHIGQVLRWSGGYAVGDFDGNPVLPVADRLRPQPAARDVAGMLQSLDHVGRVVVRRVEGADPAVVESWITAAQEHFLVAYRSRLADEGSAALLDERLLLPFRAEQECREFLYAVRHLPRWRYVPDQALQALFAEG